MNAKIDDLLKSLDRMPQVREQTLKHGIPAMEALGYYRGINAKSLDIIDEAATLPDSAEIANYFISVMHLMRGMNAVAAARLPSRLIFDNGSVRGQEKQYLDAVQLATQDQVEFRNHLVFANPDQRKWAEEMKALPGVKEAERLEAIVINGLTTPKFDV